jgi:hypothetical protein
MPTVLTLVLSHLAAAIGGISITGLLKKWINNLKAKAVADYKADIAKMGGMIPEEFLKNLAEKAKLDTEEAKTFIMNELKKL